MDRSRLWSFVAVVGKRCCLQGRGSSVIAGGFLILLGALIAGAEGTRRLGSGDKPTNQRSLYENEFGCLGLDQPVKWSREAVETCADALLGQLRESEIATEKQKAWECLQSKYEGLDETAEKLKQEREGLAEEMGLDRMLGLTRFLSCWSIPRAGRPPYDDLGAKEALEAAQEEAENCRTRLNEALGDYDLGPIEDVSDTQEAVTTLETVRTEFQEARSDLENAEEKNADAIEDRHITGFIRERW